MRGWKINSIGKNKLFVFREEQIQATSQRCAPTRIAPLKATHHIELLVKMSSTCNFQLFIRPVLGMQRLLPFENNLVVSYKVLYMAFLPSLFIQRNKNLPPYKDLSLNIHSSSIYNKNKTILKTTQISINCYVDKQIVLYSHNGILRSHKRERTAGHA